MCVRTALTWKTFTAVVLYMKLQGADWGVKIHIFSKYIFYIYIHVFQATDYQEKLLAQDTGKGHLDLVWPPVSFKQITSEFAHGQRAAGPAAKYEKRSVFVLSAFSFLVYPSHLYCSLWTLASHILPFWGSPSNPNFSHFSHPRRSPSSHLPTTKNISWVGCAQVLTWGSEAGPCICKGFPTPKGTDTTAWETPFQELEASLLKWRVSAAVISDWDHSLFHNT